MTSLQQQQNSSLLSSAAASTATAATEDASAETSATATAAESSEEKAVDLILAIASTSSSSLSPASTTETISNNNHHQNTETSLWLDSPYSRCALRIFSIFKRVLISFVRVNCFILWDCNCMTLIPCTSNQQQEDDEEEDDNDDDLDLDNNSGSLVRRRRRRKSSTRVTMDLLRQQLLDPIDSPSPDSNGNNGNGNGNKNSTELSSSNHLTQSHNGIPNDQMLLVYNLELNSNNESKLFRCDKYNRIRFHLAPSLFGRNVILFTNYNDDYTKFDRRKYFEIKITDYRNALQIRVSGSFYFYYVEAGSVDQILGSFYIVASPDLTVRRNDSKKPRSLSVNAIQCQTVLTKCMGPIDTWKDKLRVSINTGYNMIHWTPIQELGGSRSAYSIADQHRINPDFRSQSMLKAKRNCRLDDVAKVIDWLREENGVLSLTDIVLNHTANESLWLKKHPEATYNCANCPWLRPAFLLDRLFASLTNDIESGQWLEKEGISATSVTTDQQLDLIRELFLEQYLPRCRLEEFYLCDIVKLSVEFELYLKGRIGLIVRPAKNGEKYSEPKLIQDPRYRRLQCRIDFENAANLVLNEIDFNVESDSEADDEAVIDRWIKQSVSTINSKLIKLNDQKRQEMNQILSSAVDNVIKGARYERIDSGGPKLPKVCRGTPLATEYFTFDPTVISPDDLEQIEQSLFDNDDNDGDDIDGSIETKPASLYMAHNGWVMGDDPLKNFADQDSWVYLRRELVCWADSVKLRFGLRVEDSPFLWSFMEEYVKQMASTFQGLRLDNCHSTPIHVAQFMLDAARRVNPDLYLVAELFTANEEVDNIFINKLGINSLIREAMSASAPFELGRQVYRFGGEPVGSFFPDNLKANDNGNKNGKSSKKDNAITLYMRPFVHSVSHAVFFDVTHDNESPIVKRTAYDPLPSSALVSMTYAAIGSNRGYDELVPHHIHVVSEERQYQSWAENNNSEGVDFNTGIIDAKRILNQLHEFLGTHGYSQSYVDQRDRDTVVVTRHNPNSHKSVILAARTAFYPLSHNGQENYAKSLEPLKVEGKFDKLLFEMKMTGQVDQDFERNPAAINGYQKFYNETKLLVDPTESDMIDLEIQPNTATNIIRFKNFPPSSVLVFSVSLLDQQIEALGSIQALLAEYDDPRSYIISIINHLDLIDINYVLFRCNQEEMDESGGHGVYNLSNGPFIYCGLASVMFQLSKIRTHNDLGHPLCANLRDGDWLCNYIVARLKRRNSTTRLAEWLETVFTHLYQLPHYSIPRYFDSILLPLYTLIIDRTWLLSSDFVRQGDDFVRRLFLGGVALIGTLKTSPLPIMSLVPTEFPALAHPLQPTIAAGLPHFANGYMRNWGRDTFISLKGLTLLTGRFDVARTIILGFGGAMRHGLIPNLLDGGIKSRFNCRDALWWWLQAIKDYVELVPNGHEILNLKLRKIFPRDDSEPKIGDDDICTQTLNLAILECLTRHYQGIDFVERNAGKEIDAHMKQEGFRVQAGVDRQTGFVYGGNQWNCGTWMDKMGSSDKAGNRGQPATPRDGSAVEIVGLSKSILTFLAGLYDKQLFSSDSVQIKDRETGQVIESITFREWSQLIQDNFEKKFFVPEDCVEKHVNRRQIYKDTVGATKTWMDFQLRPNFLIAMVVAPELFDRQHAWQALQLAEQYLRGPLGMKTLDPSDWSYRADYDNSNDSDDPSVANGFNYHNGPEWLWPIGYYLMARLKFCPDQREEIGRITRLLSQHYSHLSQSEWFGLPELTNSNGTACSDSCPIQAWSHSTLLEVLHLKNTIEKQINGS